MNDFLYGMEKINIKKIITFSCLILLLIGLFIFKNFSSKSSVNEFDENIGLETNSTSTVFYSNDKSFSVELSNTLNLEKNISDYLLELNSEENLNILVKRKNILDGKKLSDVANADKEIFLESFSNTSNVSDVQNLLLGENPTCLYSFQYLDKTSNIAFNLQVVWLEINNSYYIFDIEYPLDDSAFYPNLVSDILTSLKIY